MGNSRLAPIQPLRFQLPYLGYGDVGGSGKNMGSVLRGFLIWLRLIQSESEALPHGMVCPKLVGRKTVHARQTLPKRPTSSPSGSHGPHSDTRSALCTQRGLIPER